MSFEDALNFVQARRTRVAPNFGFLGQLLLLSEMVREGSWPVLRSAAVNNASPSSSRSGFNDDEANSSSNHHWYVMRRRMDNEICPRTRSWPSPQVIAHSTQSCENKMEYQSKLYLYHPLYSYLACTKVNLPAAFQVTLLSLLWWKYHHTTIELDILFHIQLPLNNTVDHHLFYATSPASYFSLPRCTFLLFPFSYHCVYGISWNVPN